MEGWVDQQCGHGSTGGQCALQDRGRWLRELPIPRCSMVVLLSCPGTQGASEWEGSGGMQVGCEGGMSPGQGPNNLGKASAALERRGGQRADWRLAR